MVRVCRTGGRIGLVNWTSEGFVGQMVATRMPYSSTPPPGAQLPPLRGDEVHFAPYSATASPTSQWLDERYGRTIATPDAFRVSFEQNNYGRVNSGRSMVKIDPALVNISGSGCSLRHPIAATGPAW